VELEVGKKSYDAALKRLKKLSSKAQRKEFWLAWRGEILAKAKHFGEAREAFNKALKSISQLPFYRRKTKAVIKLEKRVFKAMENLEF